MIKDVYKDQIQNGGSLDAARCNEERGRAII